MATLGDVAAKAGVSKSVASRVLNKVRSRVRISEATRRRIEATAKELDYRPNVNARRLAIGRLESIGVVYEAPDFFRSSFIMTCLDGVVQEAHRLNFCVNLGTRTDATTTRHIKFLEDRAVDGVIVVPPASEELLDYIRSFKIPHVFVNPGSPISCDAVLCDDAGGIAAAMEHLLRLGHRRISHMTYLSSTHHSVDVRLNAYKRKMAENGLEAMVGPRAGESFVAFARRAITDDKATAFLTYDDPNALDLRMALAGIGARVPDDVSIVGVNNSIEGARMTPPLTSVNIPVKEMGEEAARMLVEKIATPGTVPSKLFPETLVERESTSAPAAPPRSRHTTPT